MTGGAFNYAKGGKVSDEESTIDKLNRYSRRGQEAIAGLIGQEDEVKYANEMANRYFPNEEEDARGDALRHLLWQGAVQQGQGTVPAALSGYGHELGIDMIPPMAPATEMDLANNALGRELGEQAKTREELLQAALEAVKSGRAKTLTGERHD